MVSKFNITKTELQSIINGMIDENDTVVTIMVESGGGIGSIIKVSNEYDGEFKDITDYGSW